MTQLQIDVDKFLINRNTCFALSRLIADVEKCRSKNYNKMKDDILRMFKSTVAAYNTEFEDDVQNVSSL